MHFRVRKNVIQLIRVNYDADKKKGVNTVVGTVKLNKPELSADLHKKLTPEEGVEFQTWLGTRHRADLLHQELAALTLSENMTLAANWFERFDEPEIARTVAADLMVQWQSLRRVLSKHGLLD